MNAEGEKSFDSIVDSVPQSGPEQRGPSLIRHGGYCMLICVYEFFAGPRKSKPKKEKDSRFKFIAEQLISTLPSVVDPNVIETTKHLLSQHRTIENTEARQRLERWACITIAVYLAFVFILLILNGLSRIIWPDIFMQSGFISDTVMTVILSTTTVNILGLVIIVLKGHFRSEAKARGLDDERIEQ